MFTVHYGISKVNYISQVGISDAALNKLERLAEFPISLPVKLICTNENGAHLFCRVEYN